jgi:hypothetical protein
VSKVEVVFNETPEQARERRQREAVQEKAAKLTAQLVLLPLLAFVVMLAVGALHGVAPAVAPIGYGTTILLVLGLDAAALITKKFRK